MEALDRQRKFYVELLFVLFLLVFLGFTPNKSDAITFSLQDTLSDPLPLRSDRFGASLSLRGSRLLVGATGNTSAGSSVGEAFLFDLRSGNLLRTFDNPSPASFDRYGNDVALDGNIVVVGAADDDTNGTNIGQVYVYEANTGVLLHTLNDPTLTSFDGFGSSVDVDGGQILIGAPGDRTNGTSTGQAYLFDASTGALLHILDDPSPTPRLSLGGDRFGWSVELGGGYSVIGAPFHSGSDQSSGEVYIFNNQTGALINTLLNPDPGSGDLFGTAVSVDGGRVIVGAYGDDTIGTDNGAAYLFDINSGALLQSFYAPTPATREFFGASVSLFGDQVLIGASRESSDGDFVGQAYLYDVNSGGLLQTFIDPTPTIGDLFSSSVALNSLYAVVGAPDDDTLGGNSGQVSVFVAQTISSAESILLLALGWILLWFRGEKR